MCANCHGEDGRGLSPGAAPLKDRWQRPLRVPDLTLPVGQARGVKRGHHSHDYFTVIMTGVGGTPMLPLAGTLDVDEIWDIAHYAQSLRVVVFLWVLWLVCLLSCVVVVVCGVFWFF